MANQEHLDILAKGVEVWNEWRENHPDECPDLAGANLPAANLRGAMLADAKLSKAALSGAVLTSAELARADLSGATLIDADLRMARLQDADLSGAKLTGADLSGADMKNANLSKGDLSGAYIRGARLLGATLTGVRLRGTTFAELDLRTVKGLDTARHDGPSSVGIDTLYLSQGKIHEAFLRGAGVPENFITYMKSLTGAALDFYSCFISYSTKDQTFADRLHVDLQAKGVRCWFAPHDIKGGKKIHEQIDEAIRAYDKLLLILSEHSMGSEWVMTEISKARKRERQEKRRMLFPLALAKFDAIRDWECFDADAGKDSAREIREYFIPDFSRWKDHDSYSKAFGRLMRDLKAGGKLG